MRVDACDHEAVRVSADGLFENRGQLRIAVWHVCFLLLPAFALARFRKHTYHLPQSKQRFVDIDALLRLLAFCASQSDPL